MSETRYIISDAAKMIDVEPHVLRYWEEELGIDIPRNEMGHRYYTDKEVKIFSAVRDLKAKGFQLKAIKMVLSAISEQLPADNIIPLSAVRKDSVSKVHKDMTDENRTGRPLETADKNQDRGNSEDIRGEKAVSGEMEKADTDDTKTALQTVKKMGMASASAQNPAGSQALLTAEEKMKHFKYMMDGIMLQALHKNNEDLAEMLIDRLSDRIIGEMDDLFRIQDEREDERFRNLDEMMRSKQRGRKEAAASGLNRKEGRRGLFKKGKM